MAKKIITITESQLKKIVKQTLNEKKMLNETLNEGLPIGNSELAQKTANTLNHIIGKMNRPDLEQKARGLVGQLISLIDLDQRE